MRGLFVTGTDTNVGKTYVSAMILRELVSDGVRVGVFKPACSGSEADVAGNRTWPDIEVLATAAQVDPLTVCPQFFHHPSAPPVAARKERRRVNLAAINAGLKWWADHADVLIVEGIGGLCCPLTETRTLADWVRWLGIPMLIVVDNRLGAINHALLTIEVARSRDIPVVGVIMNEASTGVDPVVADSNAEQIELHGQVPILGHVRHDSGSLCHDPQDSKMDWISLCGRFME
ncbi:MAG: dethiobiotin synthase [Planctomycetota bacterium]|nr:dethiobiotin synthase [Planctomycetota bacterium]